MTTSKNELISVAKDLATKAKESADFNNNSPELLAALEAVAAQLKSAGGNQVGLSGLIDQVTDLVNQAKNK